MAPPGKGVGEGTRFPSNPSRFQIRLPSPLWKASSRSPPPARMISWSRWRQTAGVLQAMPSGPLGSPEVLSCLLVRRQQETGTAVSRQHHDAGPGQPQRTADAVATLELAVLPDQASLPAKLAGMTEGQEFTRLEEGIHGVGVSGGCRGGLADHVAHLGPLGRRKIPPPEDVSRLQTQRQDRKSLLVGTLQRRQKHLRAMDHRTGLAVPRELHVPGQVLFGRPFERVAGSRGAARPLPAKSRPLGGLAGNGQASRKKSPA